MTTQFEKFIERQKEHPWCITDTPNAFGWRKQAEIQIEMLEMMWLTLKLAQQYLDYNADELCGDDLVGDQRRIARYKEVVGIVSSCRKRVGKLAEKATKG